MPVRYLTWFSEKPTFDKQKNFDSFFCAEINNLKVEVTIFVYVQESAYPN